ncbi:MAG: BstXI family restriction endonuclease [Alphaproteobacteria bacterium]|nr:MAG: BstXI family restriction endonuclease [Alphaproteobacteria bacterium]
MAERIERLPQLLDRKLYKTGQTRGADNDEIFQNRVSRNCTVLIPFEHYSAVIKSMGSEVFENGFIVLVKPEHYFTDNGSALAAAGLTLGVDAVVFYQTRQQWRTFNPEHFKWTPASSRKAPLNGQYVARVAGTTTGDGAGERINHGYTTTDLKGAGVRIYEYASKANIDAARLQLETLFWRCHDSAEVVIANGMTAKGAETRRVAIFAAAEAGKLLDNTKLRNSRLVDAEHSTICPLCLERISAADFFSRVAQAAGRETHDLTVTTVSLFHIKELRVGEFGHRPYNLGWGHHHCNVVVKDSGIDATLMWMSQVISRNVSAGYLLKEKSGASGS